MENSESKEKNTEVEQAIESTRLEIKKLREEEIPSMQRKLEESEAALAAATERSLGKDQTAMRLTGTYDMFCLDGVANPLFCHS